MGLVYVKVVIEELETEEMKRDPEINEHLQIAMKRHCMPHKFSGSESAIDENGKMVNIPHKVGPL